MLDLAQLFPFPLDQFQQEAIEHLNQDRSVVVCAPTGSGKTVIAEYAVHRALDCGKRIFYTTPLKALSNQKYRDFCTTFGPDQVGLLTGDVSINRDACVVVMTTEIFRNMLYGMALGEMGTSLSGLQGVILDECHYMNDSQRGTVWEESIIYCPSEVQLVALSATIANSAQLTDWIDRVHGPTRLVFSNFRPVPLRHHFCTNKGLGPLLNDQLTAINPALRQIKGTETPDPRTVMSFLAKKDMLPVIYFIFSRRGCDEALNKTVGLNLVRDEQRESLRLQIDAFVRAQPDAVRTGQQDALYRGIAVHHAGVLPLWKAFVEELFQQGLIQVVFATETLAAGINMPARTTVISMLSKRTDTGHRTLHASEFLQMAGRAGRRGMDPVGHVVALPSPFEAARDAARLVLSESDPLVSQFTPSYGMVLNLLERHSLDHTRTLIERSFGQYLATLHLEPLYAEAKVLREAVNQLQAQKPPVTELDLAHYEKLRGKLKSSRRILKTLEQQALETKTPVKLSEERGVLLLIQPIPKGPVETAVFIEKIPFSPPLHVVLSRANQWLVLEQRQIRTQFPQRIPLPQGLVTPSRLEMDTGSMLTGDGHSQAVAQLLPGPDAQMTAPELNAYREMVQNLEQELAQHPAHEIHRRTWEKHFEQLHLGERRLEQLEHQFDSQSAHYWSEFLKLVNVLRQMEFLTNDAPNERGAVAAALRGDNELWLGLSLMSGEMDNLGPTELAAVCCALVSEPPRPHSWVTVLPSAAVEECTEGLRRIRRDLLKRQRRNDVFTPCWLETKLAGLVEQWAGGMSWDDLGRLTNLDEGDLVRLLRRTLDLLRQIPHTPHLPQGLIRAASQAQQLMDRTPVSEVI